MGCLNKDAHDRAQVEFNKRKAELDKARESKPDLKAVEEAGNVK